MCCDSWGRKELDTTEATEHACMHMYTHTHTHVLAIVN